MHVSEKDIYLYLDNSLAQKKQQKIKLHFLVCSTCRERLKEYERMYQAMNLLEFDSPLEGLEAKVINQIKEHGILIPDKFEPIKPYSPRLVYALMLLVFVGLFSTPVTDVAGRMTQNTTTFMLNEGIDWINKAKWQVVDIIVKVCFTNFVVIILPLLFGIALIAGGAYLFISRKEVKKA